MENDDRQLIATLAYAAAFNWPLTLAEISERLIIGQRVGASGSTRPIADIAARLDALESGGTVRAVQGMYALESVAPGMFTRRIEAEKISAQKWRRMRRVAWWLQAVPFVEALFASGSLATGSSDTGSDWDVFVVARAGRLYTARVCLLAAAWVMRRLRTKHDATAPDKFCFNHYVTTDGLSLRHRSLYVAQGIASLVPLMDPQHLLARFRDANQWTGDYVTATSGAIFVRRTVVPSRMLATVRRTLETLLNTPIGARIDHALRSWQQRRIEREPATHAPGGRVCADEREIEFHPRSFEAVALSRYNALLARHGLEAFTEHDSGLTR